MRHFQLAALGVWAGGQDDGIATTMSDEDANNSERKGSSLSWAAMLWIVLFAILLAAGFAYLLVNPFFHQHAPSGL